MKSILYCRRTFIAVLAILCLVGLSLARGFDVSMAIASIAMAIAGANSVERSVAAWSAVPDETKYTSK